MLALPKAGSSTIKIKYKLTYWNPLQMAGLGLREDDKCWRCKNEKGTLLHMLYECEMVREFWSAIFTLLTIQWRPSI